MSSYILSIESITDIAESIRYILDNSSNSNCISLNTKELKNQFRNCDGKSGFYQTRKIARVLYRFNDLAGKYWGNCYINNKAIGDYTADSSTDIEKTFEHLAINWN